MSDLEIVLGVNSDMIRMTWVILSREEQTAPTGVHVPSSLDPYIARPCPNVKKQAILGSKLLGLGPTVPAGARLAVHVDYYSPKWTVKAPSTTCRWWKRW